jgi:hypothetical protein
MKSKFELFGEETRTNEPTRDEYKQYRQREHNSRQKQIAKTIGENFAAYSLLAIIALLVGSIWTEASIFSNWKKFIGDALVTIVLYVLADICASHIGTEGGKLDDEYIKNHEEYLSLRETVRKVGIVLMDAFCDWQIDVEYEYYIRKRCKELKIDYKEYKSQYEGKTLEELSHMFPLEDVKGSDTKGKVLGTIRNVKISDKAIKIFELSQIKRIELTPDILMTDGKVRNKRGGVGISGEEYVENHTIGKKHIFVTALFAVVAAVPVFTLVQEVTVGMIIYTIFKIALMLYRMYCGYSRGAKGYNTVDPKHLQDKNKYLYLYLEFVEKKIYLELADKYDIINIIGNQTYVEDKWQEQVNEAGAGAPAGQN